MDTNDRFIDIRKREEIGGFWDGQTISRRTGISSAGRRNSKMQLRAETASNQLTPRQLQLLRVIAYSQASRCYSPTIAELARELRISRSTVFEHIGEVRNKDLLFACPGKARSFKLT